MLNTMRAISKGIVAKLLMLLLVISFGVWGVGDILRSRGATHVATVGGEEIGVGEFQHAMQRINRELLAKGIQAPEEKIQMMVLQQLVTRKLVAHQVAQSGLYVDDATIARLIANDPQFKNLDGKFSDSAFRAYLKENGLPEAVFLEQLKLEQSGRFLMDSMSVRDITPPAAALQLLARALSETRDVVLIDIPTTPTTPTDADILAYYNDYKSTFMAPEKRTIEYIAFDLPKKDSAASTELSNNIEDALAGGATLEEAVAKSGVHAPLKRLDGITAEQYASTTDKTLKTALTQGFQLASGETSNLLTSPDGHYLLVRTAEITPATPKPLEAVKPDVAKRVAAEQARNTVLKRVGDVKAALAKEPNWQAALAEFKLPARVLSNLPRPRAGVSKGPLPQALAEAVFEQPVGNVAGPYTDEKGSISLAYVLASHAPLSAPSSEAMAAALSSMKAGMEQEVESAAFAAMAKTQKVQVNSAAFAKTQEP